MEETNDAPFQIDIQIERTFSNPKKNKYKNSKTENTIKKKKTTSENKYKS